MNETIATAQTANHCVILKKERGESCDFFKVETHNAMLGFQNRDTFCCVLSGCYTVEIHARKFFCETVEFLLRSGE